VNSSQLLCDPNRAPLPETRVPPNGAYASLFSEFNCSYRFERILGDLRSPASAGEAISWIAARWGIHGMPRFAALHPDLPGTVWDVTVRGQAARWRSAVISARQVLWAFCGEMAMQQAGHSG
jgi:hypothetical protein